MKPCMSNVSDSPGSAVSSTLFAGCHINDILRTSFNRGLPNPTSSNPSSEMVSDSIAGCFHYFDENSVGAGNLKLDSKVTSPIFLGQRMSLLPSFTDNKVMSHLTVATDFPCGVDSNQFRSCSSSPPPPALSPANSSPQLVAGLFNQTASPSPPIIVAEIGGNSSASSRATSEKGSHTGGPVNCFRNANIPPRFKELQHSSVKSCTVPRLTPTSSSSPSSSSSTSSSSVLNDRAEYVTNGLPILEKISIALGSPLRNLPDSTQSVLQKDEKAIEKSPCPRSPQIYEVPTSVGESLKDFSTFLRPTVVADRLENVEDYSVPTEKSPVRPRVSRRGGAVGRGTGRKRIRSKNARGDSDSDFGAGGSRFGRSSRGKRSVTHVDRRGSAKKSRLSTTNKPFDVSQSRTSAEAISNRRYLESPFLCLCQSGGTVSSISQAVERLHAHHRRTTSLQENKDVATSSADASSVAASHPAHIICPALQDPSSSQTGTSSQAAQSSIPSNCPLNTTVRSSDQLQTDPISENAEFRTLFSTLTYKPGAQLKNRDSCPTDPTSSGLWVCAFCGVDNSFLELGSLYGPYWITEAECAQLPPEVIAAKAAPSVTAPSKPVEVATPNNTRVPRKARSGIVTSAVTRSGAAASQGQAIVAKTGALRLVIKARTSRSASCAAKPPPDLLRIGPSGEVWFHLECVLWAPGTCVQGNGIVTGLGEALQLSLSTDCSHCGKRGAILSCCSRGCDLSYHYYCALLAGCKLNDEQYTLMCKKHQIYS